MDNSKAKRLILKRVIKIGKYYFNIEKRTAKKLFSCVMNRGDYNRNELLDSKPEILKACIEKMKEFKIAQRQNEPAKDNQN